MAEEVKQPDLTVSLVRPTGVWIVLSILGLQVLVAGVSAFVVAYMLLFRNAQWVEFFGFVFFIYLVFPSIALIGLWKGSSWGWQISVSWFSIDILFSFFGLFIIVGLLEHWDMTTIAKIVLSGVALRCLFIDSSRWFCGIENFWTRQNVIPVFLMALVIGGIDTCMVYWVFRLIQN